ncbi:MAG: ferredoxin [Frankiales bacterium]|nr:ferredoxin [Frankiales bacterium]
MVHVVYLDPQGGRHELEGETGSSVMDLATKNGVPGIVAECGGFMNCASCHVYVDDTWAERVGPPPEEEGEMLEGALSPQLPTSRLSCQVPLTDELDGLVVRVAPEQQ